jgi:hypothetical protein
MIVLSEVWDHVFTSTIIAEAVTGMSDGAPGTPPTESVSVPVPGAAFVNPADRVAKLYVPQT